ncbi:MAG: right-handed parallel beta-helix repeat-containing protein [bacterium]
MRHLSFRSTTCLMLPAVLLVHLVTAASAPARTWRVPTDAPTVGAGIDSASAGDVVEVACGEYTVPPLYLKSGITLRSESGDPACVTLRSTGSPGPVLRFDELTDISVEGLTLTGVNNTGGVGGGAFGYRSTFSIIDCVIRDNLTSTGGGIELRQCTDVYITGCLFRGNHAQADGGALVLRNTTATVTGCTFSNNLAVSLGGAIYNAESFTIYRNCTVTGNEVDPANAAFYVTRYPVPVIDRSIIAHNIGGAGLKCWPTGTVPSVQCSNIFGNPGGDWIACLTSLEGMNGNISEDPQFCSSTPDLDERWTLQSDSPCVPVDYGDCPLMGAWPVGCQTTATENRTWGQV